MKVNVLGTEYKIITKNYKDDPYFAKWNADGYCDGVEKEIVLCNLLTYPDFDETAAYAEKCQKQVLRHEIIHAFLNESGLQSSATKNNGAWARNEEMVDFFAIQFPKIQKAFEALNIAD